MTLEPNSDPTYSPQESGSSDYASSAVELDSNSVLIESSSRGDSDLEDADWDLEDTENMSNEQPSASDTLPNVSEHSIANEDPIPSGNFSGGNTMSYANIQSSSYLNEVEYFPLSVFPAGMPSVEPVGVFGEMVSDCTVLFDSSNPGKEDDDSPKAIAPLDYNPGNRHPVTPYTIIPPDEMYLPVQASRVSAAAQPNVRQDDGEQSLELSQNSIFPGQGQAPLFQGYGLQIPPLQLQPTNAELYQEDYFWAEQQMEVKRNQEIYHGGHLYQEPRILLPEFVVEPPLLDCDKYQPSTPKLSQHEPIYDTPGHGTQIVPQTYPPKQAKAHREDKQRRKSDFFCNKDSDFNVEKAHSQLTGTLMEIAESVKLNPRTTVSKSFSSRSIEEIGPFHYALRDSTMATRRRSDSENLDSVRWEKRMRALTMNKRSSPDAKFSDTPLLGQYDSSSGQDSPSPKSKKTRVGLPSASKKAPTTARRTSKKTRLADRPVSSKAKRKGPSPDRGRLQTPPTKTMSRHPIPKSWGEASAEDILLFELRSQGAGFPTIAEVLRTTRCSPYNPRTLRNRHWKIKHKLGDLPDSLQPNKDDVPERADEDTSGLSTPHFDTDEFNYF